MESSSFRNIPIPKKLDITGNLATNWRTFKRDWRNYEIASKLAKEDMEIRVATFLACIGSEAMNIFDGLNLTEEQKSDITEVLSVFEIYCIGKTNETFERFIFNSRVQSDDESIEFYVSEIRKLARTCNFGNLEESLMRDRLVIGVRCDTSRRKLLQEQNLTLKKAIDIARAMEISKGQMSKIKVEAEAPIHKLKISRPDRSHVQNEENKRQFQHKQTCYFCCRSHPFKKELCPAFGKKCSTCGGKNHFQKSKYCRQKIQIIEENSESEEDAWLNNISGKRSRAYAKLEINNIEISFQLDTGADVNTICQKYVKKEQVTKTKTNLKMWNDTKQKPLGETRIEVFNPKTKTSHFITFVVVTNNLSCLLGLPTIKDMNFVTFNTEKYIGKIEIGEVLGDLGQARLTVDTTKTPRQLPCRKIPFALQNKVKKEITSLVDRGILMPITEPTEWVSQMALAEKSNGDIRICIDPAPLNEALQREHYKLPTLDDVLHQFKDAKLFTKLDIKQAYWHVRLDEESSYLTTMITPFGRYRWMRLPFGLKVSSEIFQRKLTDALEGLKNTVNVADDIVIAGCGKDITEAQANLKRREQELDQRCQEKHIVLNDQKRVSEKTEIPFMGHLITSAGIKPDPEKISAIQNMPSPTDVPAVRRLCGTVQYLARFIPNLAQHTEPLRRLTKKSSVWNWTSECDEAVAKIKHLIAEDCKLAYFDVNKDLHLQVDSSKDGVGCFLHQDGRPVEYASKTLTETQKRWAQIEKELLSVIIGLERFDQYTYGRKVFVENDHKPLEHIIKKPLSQVPRRLQNLLMRLHRYDIVFKYVEGSKLNIADTLSRAVAGSETHDIPDQQIHTVTGVSDSMLERIRDETKIDESLQILVEYTRDGWPENHNQNPAVSAYRQIKDSISHEDGIMYNNERLIIPKSMRKEVKKKLHAAHLGHDSMMRRARRTIYWPGMTDEVKQLAENCDACNRRKPANQKEKLQQHEEGNAPWEKVGIDFFEIKDHHYLVVVDYYSTYIEVEYMKSTTSTQTIKKLKQTFARWGIPQEMVSDNGPQLVSAEFKEFLKCWGIIHKPSDPLYPKGNGKAEAAVKTIKNMLIKCHENNEDPYLALLELRATPRQDVNMSPAEIMCGRVPRTSIPQKNKETSHNPEYQKLREKRRESIRKCHDRGATELKPIPHQAPVFFKTAQEKWCPGKVTQRKGRKYEILGENGGEYTRNRLHIRPKSSPFDETFEAILTTPDEETSQPETDITERPTRQRRAPIWHKDYVRS